MGGPMDYLRVLRRNHLLGDYAWAGKGTPQDATDGDANIAGDLRRMERDVLEGRMLEEIAKKAGFSKRTTRKVLVAFMTFDWAQTYDYGDRPAIKYSGPVPDVHLFKEEK